jgi:hypothetical protein
LAGLALSLAVFATVTLGVVAGANAAIGTLAYPGARIVTVDGLRFDSHCRQVQPASQPRQRCYVSGAWTAHIATDEDPRAIYNWYQRRGLRVQVGALRAERGSYMPIQATGQPPTLAVTTVVTLVLDQKP